MVTDDDDDFVGDSVFVGVMVVERLIVGDLVGDAVIVGVIDAVGESEPIGLFANI